jgi:hypothetical protein
VSKINQRYFGSKKDAVEMFSVYMQEVNFKSLIIFNFTYVSHVLGLEACIGNSSFGICGVVSWRDSVRNIILLCSHTHTHTHTHTPYLINTSLTPFVFTPLAVHTLHSGCITITNLHRSTFVECCSTLLTCVIIFSTSFTREN